ncbi:hypothetical protein B0H14DRAFT_2571632 [Mycena olivaceomarginata]|nr:hypothetical protein B0H14DRAFT_2571632 [Mycena olivaceomarginata]
MRTDIYRGGENYKSELKADSDEEKTKCVFEECVGDTREEKAGRAGGNCDREESGKRCEGIWMDERRVERDGNSVVRCSAEKRCSVRDSEAITEGPGRYPSATPAPIAAPQVVRRPLVRREKSRVHQVRNRARRRRRVQLPHEDTHLTTEQRVRDDGLCRESGVWDGFRIGHLGARLRDLLLVLESYGCGADEVARGFEAVSDLRGGVYSAMRASYAWRDRALRV